MSEFLPQYQNESYIREAVRKMKVCQYIDDSALMPGRIILRQRGYSMLKYFRDNAFCEKMAEVGYDGDIVPLSLWPELYETAYIESAESRLVKIGAQGMLVAMSEIYGS